MNEKQALSMMVPPSKKRPSIMLGGIVQIQITRACNQSCFSCTQLSNMAGKPAMMSVENFRTACESLRNYWGVVGVFGGNPTMHPLFEDICKVMKETIPFHRRGLWSNDLRGKGKICRETFDPSHSNLNNHMDAVAHAEMVRDWPECVKFLKPLDSDSRHSPPFVAMVDVEPDEGKRWDMISRCDINQFWSALIGEFRGELKGYFCEVAYSLSVLHEDDPDWPDVGVKVEKGWWNKGMEAFKHQAKQACHNCGVPLKGYGQLAVSDPDACEQVSKMHAPWFKPKIKDRRVELVVLREQLLEGRLPKSTDYVENSKR